MSVHHQQAVEMTAVVLAGSTDADVRSMAWDIATSQSNQIGEMHAWLGLWNEPLISTNGYMTWMPMDGSSMPGMSMSGMSTSAAGGMQSMPGMATDEQMTQLRAAKGKALDHLFLTLMIAHHKGGAPMAVYEQQHGNVAIERALAESMTKTQSAEVDLMNELLKTR